MPETTKTTNTDWRVSLLGEKVRLNPTEASVGKFVGQSINVDDVEAQEEQAPPKLVPIQKALDTARFDYIAGKLTVVVLWD